MSKNYILLFCLSLMLCTKAFAQYPSKYYDFSNTNVKDVNLPILRDEIIKHRQLLDSIYQANKMDSLELLFNYANTNTTNYGSFTLAIEYFSTSYGELADELKANGFEALPERMYAFGGGFTIKRKRFLHEYLLNIFIGRSSTKDGVTIKVDGGNLLNYNFGYAFLDFPRFQLYPFMGISQQFTEIHLTKEPSADNQYGTLFEIANDANDIDLRQNSWRIAGGFEFDVHVKYSARSSGIILGLRYGLTSTFSEGKYKSNGVKMDYDPGVDIRDSYFSLVLRFYGRSENKL